MMLRTDILANDIGSVLEGRAAVECFHLSKYYL